MRVHWFFPSLVIFQIKVPKYKEFILSGIDWNLAWPNQQFYHAVKSRDFFGELEILFFSRRKEKNKLPRYYTIATFAQSIKFSFLF